jgi:hypothetical protein
METITASVGRDGVNRPDDVRKIQGLLSRHADWFAPLPAPTVTGNLDEVTAAAIVAFQRDPGALLTQDGRVDPNGFTLRWLSRDSIPKRQHPVFVDGPVVHIEGAPSDTDYTAAARRLSCEVAAIKAVSQVETGIRGCWEADGRPVILYERHYFKRFTNGEFDASHDDLSHLPPNIYGPYSHQHRKLRRAAALNEEAALKSASWGGYQIMGANYASAGFASVAAFVSAQMESERRQLDAFVAVVLANRSWLKAIQDKDWTAFARGYNGPGYRAFNYDTKMKAAYEQLAPPPPAKRTGQPSTSGTPGRPGAPAPIRPGAPPPAPRTTTRGL